MKILNLTGEPIILCGNLIPGSRKRKVQILTETNQIDEVEWKGTKVPIFESIQKGVVNLPDPEPNTLIIVNGMVAGEAGLALGRKDVYTLSRRDAQGQAHGLVRIVDEDDV